MDLSEHVTQSPADSGYVSTNNTMGSAQEFASDGNTLVSQDGLRQFRAPSYKPNFDQWRANFERREVPRGPWLGNGHLDITDLP